MPEWTYAVISVVLVWAALLGASLLLRTIYRRGCVFARSWSQQGRIPRRMQELKLMSAQRIAGSLIAVCRLAVLAAFLFLLSLAAGFTFSRFPATERYSDALIRFFLVPLGALWTGFLSYLPNLGFLIVLVTLVYYAIRLLRLLSAGVQRGVIVIPGFYPEWAEPTSEIGAALVIAFGLVVAFPYLPGGDSPALRGVSIFIGVLLSLGSGSAMGNMIAGVILTYMRAFQPGDRVKIAETMGDIVEKTLLVTRIRTNKNAEIIIPNSMVLASHIVNYSASKFEHPLILNTGVTIGYDAPWRKVHELLISAAVATDGVLSEPAPFVLQTSLNDFHVSYEINAYTHRPNEMIRIYSDLHRNIQEKFNEAGVEIMSPAYTSLRDGNRVTIPAHSLPADYEAPSFRLSRTDLRAGRE
jgi:small-conductance mechanosensitive channel